MNTKFWGVAVLALFISVQNANADEHKVILIKMTEQTKATNRCTKLQTDANFFRAYGTGAARYQNAAKIKAQMKAGAELLKTIQAWIKEFLSKYLNEIGQNPKEYIQLLEERSRDILEEKIFNAIIIACDGVAGIDDDGLCNVYLTMEIKRKKGFEILSAALSTDKNWNGIYDRQRMEALFKAEMKELKK